MLWLCDDESGFWGSCSTIIKCYNIATAGWLLENINGHDLDDVSSQSKVVSGRAVIKDYKKNHLWNNMHWWLHTVRPNNVLKLTEFIQSFDLKITLPTSDFSEWIGEVEMNKVTVHGFSDSTFAFRATVNITWFKPIRIDSIKHTMISHSMHY